MALYVSFPTCMFYIFNQPAFFENYVIQLKQKFSGQSDPHAEKFIQEMRKKIRLKALEINREHEAKKCI